MLAGLDWHKRACGGALDPPHAYKPAAVRYNGGMAQTSLLR
jgi:hypothetical protein